MHSFRNRRGHLHCEGVDLEGVARSVGTPAYVYSAATIRDHFRRLDRALAPLDHTVCYAVKANSNIAVLDLLAREGAGFDIVSAGELHRVLKAGGDPARCTFAGVGKTPDEIAFALRHGILCFNVESEPELLAIDSVARRLRRRAPVCLRVNPDVESGTHAYITTGKSENKFGLPIDRAAATAVDAARMPGIDLRGLHMHIGSQITEPAPFRRAIRKIAPLARHLRRTANISLLSVGGGIGIVYRPALESGPPAWWRRPRRDVLTIARYADAVIPPLEALGLHTIIEPGRFIVGNAGALLARVLYVKRSAAKTFVIVDTAMNDLIRPSLYGGQHEIVPVTPRRAAARVTLDVVGPICETGDFLARDRSMPLPEPGDLLAVLSAGAYGFSMASNYNSRPLAAEILVDGDRFDVVRSRQTRADLTRGERIPNRTRR